MKKVGWLVIGAVVAMTVFVVACGSDEEDPAPGDTTAGGGVGMIAPNTFMTYEGQRYQLVNMLFASMVEASEFSEAGEASAADVDLKGDMRVFNRAGDSALVYTYSAPTADADGLWLAWRLVG